MSPHDHVVSPCCPWTVHHEPVYLRGYNRTYIYVKYFGTKKESATWALTFERNSTHLSLLIDALRPLAQPSLSPKPG